MTSHDNYVPEEEIEKYIGKSTSQISDTAETNLFTTQEGFSKNYTLIQVKLIQRLSELGWLKSKDLEEAAEEFSQRFATSFAEQVNEDATLQRLITNLPKNPQNMDRIISIVIQFISKKRLRVDNNKVFKKRPQ